VTIATVWLLVMTGHVNSGNLGAVQPHLFPTAAACEQVVKNVQPREALIWRCIQTQVYVQGSK